MSGQATKSDVEVWVDRGDPNCEGSPLWTQDASGKRTFTCPDCSLHWHFVPGSTGGAA